MSALNDVYISVFILFFLTLPRTGWMVLNNPINPLKSIWLLFELSGFGKDPTTSKYELYANVDQLSLIAKYKVKGSVIILPVVGSGPANLTFGKPHTFLFAIF